MSTILILDGDFNITGYHTTPDMPAEKNEATGMLVGEDSSEEYEEALKGILEKAFFAEVASATDEGVVFEFMMPEPTKVLADESRVWTF